MYQHYKIARDRAWQAIIETGINSLPIKLSDVARYYNIHIVSYSSAGNEPEDGYTVKRNNRLIVYYNDSKPNKRIRFTIAHELGHCLLGHLNNNFETAHRNSEVFDYENIIETQANIFARDLLMPATVLHSLGVSSAKEIADICNVSMQSAEIRFNRLLELNKRGMYNKHPLEKQVYNRFLDYVQKNKI